MSNSSRAGFTLLEVLVATVIMGVAVTALITGLTQSVKNAARLADYDRAVMLARTEMNDLLLNVNLPFEGGVDGDFAADQAGGMATRLEGCAETVRHPAQRRAGDRGASGDCARCLVGTAIGWPPHHAPRKVTGERKFPIPVTPALVNQ